jgi:hypothetical protein
MRPMRPREQKTEYLIDYIPGPPVRRPPAPHFHMRSGVSKRRTACGRKLTQRGLSVVASSMMQIDCPDCKRTQEYQDLVVGRGRQPNE